MRFDSFRRARAPALSLAGPPAEPGAVAGADHGVDPARRRLLGLGLAAAGALVLPPTAWGARPAGERRLSLYNIHTGERLSTIYWAQGRYLDEALHRIDHVLRDHRDNSVHPMDPALLDLLVALQSRLGTHEPFHVISGYRSPATNARLRKVSTGVAKRSLHMQGKAIDIRLPGVELKTLRRTALAMKAGGVGYYPKSGFVHVDTGRVRHW